MGGVCTVVGVGPGLGRAVALEFARAGFDVGLSARNEAALEGYAREVKELGVRCHARAADAAHPAELVDAFDAIHGALGATDVLVYNPAVLRRGLPSSLTPHQLMDDLRVNVGGALACVHEVLPSMRDKQAGTILMTSGGLALDPIPQFASLAAGKAALRSLTHSLGKELSPLGIHVASVVVCGFIKPESAFDPARIAREYTRLHAQPRAAWEHEVLFRGA
jgi:NAD(P)-dependent dehydrogenase (short-subunit alcohol dehydrogenase family)